MVSPLLSPGNGVEVAIVLLAKPGARGKCRKGMKVCRLDK